MLMGIKYHFFVFHNCLCRYLSFDCYNGKINATFRAELVALPEKVHRKCPKPSQIRRRKRHQAMRAEESSRNFTEDFSCTRTPPSEPTTETSNCED